MAKRKHDQPNKPGKPDASTPRGQGMHRDKPGRAAPGSSYLRRYGIDTVWAHLALNLASVLMLTLAFPKPGWGLMAFFAPVPVGVLAMRSTRLWTLGWTTLLVFGGWWSLRVYWLTAVSPGAPWGVGLVMGLWMALMAVALARVQRRFRPAMTLTLPVFWVAQEAVRSVWPWGGFPWFTLGSSQAMWRPAADGGAGLGFPSGYLVQTADLFGVLTVSFLVAMTAGLMVDLIARPMTKRNTRGRVRPRRTVVVAGSAWLVLMVGALVYGIGAAAAGDSPSIGRQDQATITVIQTNVPQSNKIRGTAEQRRADWDAIFALTDAALEDGPTPSLIVWPETMVLRPINDAYVRVLDGWIDAWAAAVTDGTWDGDAALREMVALSMADRAYRDRLDAYVAGHGVPMIVGGRAQFVPTTAGPDDDRLMNSAFLVEPGGDSYARYSKQQLVPFGEYIPGPAWVKGAFMKYLSPYGPGHDYTLRPGERAVVFEVQPPSVREGGPASRRDAASVQAAAPPEPFRVATPICFEDVVGHLCRDMVYGGSGTKRVDVLVNLTNDGWFAGTHQGWQHMQLASVRCIENRVPMVRSVNTGVSGFIDSNGRVVEVVEVGGRSQEVAGHATRAVTLDSRTTLYGRVGEAGSIAVGVLAVVMLLGTWVPTRKVRGKK